MTIIILLSIIFHIMMGFMICTPHQIITGVQIKMRWAGHVERMADMRVTSRVLGGETRGKKTTWKRRKGNDNINMDLQEI